MKRLTERTQISSTINFHKMPTILLDISNTDEYGIKGGELLVDCGKFRTGEPWYEHAELRIYTDKRKLVVSGDGGCGIHAGFGYDDIMEMMNNRNLPIIHTDEDVLIVPVRSEAKDWFTPFVIHTGKTTDPHCYNPIEIVPDAELDRFTDALMSSAGFYKNSNNNQ